MTPPRIVWVLGSGFSKSLGGPLLPDLLSPRGWSETQIRFGHDYSNVYKLYRELRKSKDDTYKRLSIWEHAEEFLSFADTLVERPNPDNPWSNHSRRQLIAPHIEALRMTPEAFRADVIKAIACECMFTVHSDLNEEAWQPYLEWAASLDDNNTIITFNYDVVLEELAKKEECQHLAVVPPQGPETIYGDRKRVRVLKLHGSCNWFLGKDDKISTPGTEDFRHFLDNGEVPLIGIPGPTKKLHRDSHFKGLWDQAEKALKDAQVIVFLGYRFPPSDSEARKCLLRAIGARGTSTSASKKVYTALGPNTSDGATQRLVGLLHGTLGQDTYQPYDKPNPRPGDLQYQINPQPLYAEDFLSVFPVANLKELPRVTSETIKQR